MQKDLPRLLRDPNLIPSEKQNLLSRIADQAAAMNMPCYIVGGFVRDLLLGEPINDLDVIVEGDAIELGDALVKKYGGKLTPHTKFRTAVWHLPSSFIIHPSSLDLITARKETYSFPGALPTVKPSTIDDDLRRRDFTINAMAIRLDGDHFGELLDPLNGQADLEKKIIRVLHPLSFEDDPTRIFRAVRYATRYSFNLHLSSFTRSVHPFLSSLSGERIRHELDLVFAEEKCTQMLAQLHQLGVFDVFTPRLPKFNEQYSGLINSTPPAEFDILENKILLNYLLWLADSPLDVVEFLSSRLDFNSKLTEASRAMLQLKNELASLANAKPSTWTKRLEKIPLIAIYALWLISNKPALREFLVTWRHIKQKTNGDDLKNRGVPTGPRYKEILLELRNAWLDGKVKNDKEEEELLNTLL